MVALAVLAVAMSGLIQAGAQRVDNVGYLRDRTLATWVANNRLTQLRLEGGWPAAGTREGEQRMSGRTWYWQAEIEETPEERMRRVNVAVRSDPDGAPVARLTGFLPHPEDRIERGLSP